MIEFKFTPKQWVLVRGMKERKWALAQYSHYDEDSIFPNKTLENNSFRYCIPYEGNEHLLGTTDDYVEPWQPKEGDFISFGVHSFYNVCICDSVDKYGMKCKVGLDYKNDLINTEKPFYVMFTGNSVRPSSDFARNRLLSKLHEIGKDWDEEKKEIVGWKWEPGIGDEYYYISATGKIPSSVWVRSPMDILRYKIGNFFRTKEEARAMSEKIKKVLKGE